MRIGIDLYAIQAPSCRGRGIGRYANALMQALLVVAPSWDFVFYRRHDLELDWETPPGAREPEGVAIGPDPRDEPDGALQRIVQANPHGLDWLLIPNPVVERRGFALPEPVPGGPRLAAVVHDFIPALFPKHYLQGPGLAEEYANDLRRLRAYDLLLANSEATRRDCVAHLGVPDRRTANILASTDLTFFRPARDDEGAQDAAIVRSLGIAGSFLYYLGNVDRRKNVLGLLDVYAALPPEVREGRPLVLTFGRNAWFDRVLAEKIAALGLEGRVIATGPIEDSAVRALCRRCDLFLSPSLYEGFGLPILEAMGCGAAVIAADNSSQPEVVGTAGHLARTGDTRGWAEAIARLVSDPDRLDAMRRASMEQAARFSWADSARRLRTAIESRRGPDRVAPGLAIVAHPSARPDGFAAEVASAFAALCESSGATAFLDIDQATALPPLPTRSGWHERRVLGRILAMRGEMRVVHLIDTIADLDAVLDDLRAHRGEVLFAATDISDPEGLIAGVGPERGLRELIGLASAVRCRSEALRRGLIRFLDPDLGAKITSAA